MYIIENNLEVVEYENLLLPISIKIRELIQYKNKRALCHWHDDIEIIKILSGSMNFYINGEIFHLIKDDILIVNSKQIHYGYEYNHDDCKFICLMVNPSVLKINKAMYQEYVIPIIENNGLLAWCLKNNEGKQLDRILFALIDWQEKSCRAKEWRLLSLVYDLWYQIYNVYETVILLGTLAYIYFTGRHMKLHRLLLLDESNASNFFILLFSMAFSICSKIFK